ncbi:MAG TPA: glycosyltransferase family A protein [Allosphingosinicella sp.]|jgi:glycosyltransferase involved in cell wall biosynthesis
MSRLVSVVMPVLDAAGWLDEAIESILAQTHEELELIVVDDGSADDSPQIADRAAARDSRVRTLFLDPAPELTSSSRAANAGLALARGRWIARMDADDISLPRRLELQLAFLEERELDACGGLAENFGAQEEAGLFSYSETGAAIERELVFRVGILHPTLLARAELMRAHPYREQASHEDYEWLVRISASGARLGNLQEVILRRRTHPDQAHRRHHALFVRDLRRYRFVHVRRLFPGTSPADYQVLAQLAEETETDPAMLPAAAAWLVRLADLPDPGLRHLLARRWEMACDRAGVEAGDPMRERVGRQIRGAA